MASLSTGSATHAMPSTFLSKANVVEPSPRLVRGDSSMMLQPALESSPFSISCRLLSPICPSSVRVVPFRFIASSLPGYHSTSLPLSVKRMFNTWSEGVAALIFPPILYFKVKAEVLMVSQPSCSLVENCGTGRRRLMMANVARSSNRLRSLYWMRIISGVKTVKRAFPDVITALGSATGFSVCAIREVRLRKREITVINRFITCFELFQVQIYHLITRI